MPTHSLSGQSSPHPRGRLLGLVASFGFAAMFAATGCTEDGDPANQDAMSAAEAGEDGATDTEGGAAPSPGGGPSADAGDGGGLDGDVMDAVVSGAGDTGTTAMDAALDADDSAMTELDGPSGPTNDASVFDGTASGDAASTEDAEAGAPDAQPGTDASARTNPCGPPSLDPLPNEFLDLGHTSYMRLVQQSGDRLLTMDAERWILWNLTSKTRVASGSPELVTSNGQPVLDGNSRPVLGFADLKGSTLVVEQPLGTFAIRDAANGAVLRTVVTESAPERRHSPPYGLAFDGSYLWSVSSTKLQIWARTGTNQVSVDGDFSLGKIFAAADRFRVAAGAAGANVVRAIHPETGAAETSPAFSGTFITWFADGQRFITRTGSTSWIYPKSAWNCPGSVDSSLCCVS